MKVVLAVERERRQGQSRGSGKPMQSRKRNRGSVLETKGQGAMEVG